MSSLAGYTEGAHFHVGSNHKWSLRRIADSKFVMHEAAINYGVIFENNFIAVTALQALLIMVALMGAILHLLKIPYHTKLSYCGNQVALLLPILCDLWNFKMLDHKTVKSQRTNHKDIRETCCMYKKEYITKLAERKGKNYLTIKRNENFCITNPVSGNRQEKTKLLMQR